MEITRKRLASAYRRRTACAALGAALMTVGIVSPSLQLLAQGAPPDVKQPTDPGKAGAASKDPSNAIRIIPMPRKDGQGKAVQAPAGAPPLPGGLPPMPGGAPGIPPGGVKPGTLISFDFHGSDIMNVLQLLARVTGEQIVVDPSLTGQVTIISPKQVTIDEAFRILQSVLAVRGFAAASDGSVITIAPIPVITANSGTPIKPDVTKGPANPRNPMVTQVIPLENVDAEAMAKDLLPLVTKGASLIGSTGSNTLILTDYSDNIQRIIELVDALDKSSNRAEMAVYQLNHAEAAPIADLITNLYSKISVRGKGAGAAPQPGQPGFNPGNPQGAQAGGAGRPSVVAIPDARTNSVIVVASRELQEQIAKNIINRLDDDDTKTLDTQFRKIHFADAQTIANQVNSVLSNEHGTPANSNSSSSRNFGGFFDPFGFGGGGGNNSQQTVASTDPFGKVSADPRTNSVLITASEERMVKISQLIDQLDVDVPVESTTFVIPLKNAQAADVAYALSQAFGTGQSNNNNFNPFAFFGGGGNSRTNTSGNGINNFQPIQRRQQTSSSGRSVRPPGPPNAPDGQSFDSSGNDGSGAQGIPGVMTANGFVPSGNTDASMDPRSRQFGFGFGGRQQQRLGNSNGPQYGPGANGAYVNLLQLQNNVFAVPSPNGDSLIVTTTPNNYEAIKGIIDALDVVPSQVMLEVVVAEVTLTSNEKFGFNINGALQHILGGGTNVQALLAQPATGGSTTTALDPNVSGQQVVLSGTNYTAILQAMSSNDKVKVLATPRVFTSNNQQALIDISTQIPYIDGQTISTLSTATSQQVLFKNIGFYLLVTPRITRQGQVTVDVIQDASDLLRYNTLGTGTNAVTAPVFNDRYTDTSVTVQDNETVVLGGLIRDRTELNTTKIPLLGDIPFIGQFFRSREKSRDKVELMIFITPHVVTTVEGARQMTRQTSAPVTRQVPDIYGQQKNLAPDPDPTADPKKKKPGKGQPNTPGPGGVTPNSDGANPTGTHPNPAGSGPNPGGTTP